MAPFDNSAPPDHWRTLVMLAEDAPFGVLLLDRDGCIVWENDALRTMLGLAPDQASPVHGLRLSELPNLLDAGAGVMFDQLIAGEPMRDMLVDFKTAVGRPVSLSFDAQALRDESGAISGYWAVVHDATGGGREQAGRMLSVQRMEIIGLAATGVIHDLNNLLTALGGTLEVVRGGHSAGPEILAALDGMVRRSRDIAGRLLEVARPGTNQREPMDLRTPVRQAADLMRHGLGPRVHVDLTLPHLQVPALCDRTALLQCFFNLGTNARDAMAGAGRVSLSLQVVRDRSECERRGWPGRRYARLLFQDDGPGIPAEKAARIFEPFFTTKGDAGTGMGLAVVQRTVADHDGRVDLLPSESGACFRIELPLYLGPVEDDEPTRTLTVPLSLRGGGPPLEGMRILLADDEEALRLMLREALTLRGAEVTAVPDGPSALAALQTAQDDGTPFHAGLIDMHMPGLSGLDLLTALRGRAADLPLLASSGLEPGPDEAAEMTELGVRFLPKPFTLGVAVEALLTR